MYNIYKHDGNCNARNECSIADYKTENQIVVSRHALICVLSLTTADISHICQYLFTGTLRKSWVNMLEKGKKE